MYTERKHTSPRLLELRQRHHGKAQVIGLLTNLVKEITVLQTTEGRAGVGVA
jgi:hypothetical protein